MKGLIFQIIAAILGILLADQFVKRVSLEIIPGQSSFFGIKLTEYWHILVLVGSILGLINFFLKPILNTITLPLRILTLGLFSLVINMLMIWLVDILFLELKIEGIVPLFWTTIIIWLLSLFLGLYKPKEKVIIKEP